MKKYALVFVLALVLVMAVTVAEAAPLKGAIFTTTPDGGIVNENVHYEQKIEVYLDGGPPPNAPQTAAGLPDGLYVFQVTNPSGWVLLSQDPAKCRIVRIEDGVIKELMAPSSVDLTLSDDYTVGNGGNAQTFPCHIQDEPDGVAGPSGRHDTNTDLDHGEDGAIVVQLMPFLDTPNPGGVYKAWVTPLGTYSDRGGDLEDVPSKEVKKRGVFQGFANDPGFGPPRSVQKTDNFKVKEVPPRIKVLKYEDMNGNGILDAGDIEYTGWEIEITETLFDGTQIVNTCYTPCDRAVTPNSTVTVTEIFPSNEWELSFVSKDEIYVEPPAVAVDVPFAEGDMEHTVVFGNWRYAKKAGYKFHDLNANHAWDAGEPGLNGWTINVFDSEGALVDSIDTAADANGDPGYYAFTLPPGTYKVCEELETDWYQSAPQTADGCYHITLGSGEEDLNNHFGNYQKATKAGYKFHDLNANHVWDADEPGLNGWTINVFDSDGAPAGSIDTANDANGEPGYYKFSLDPGTYKVCEELETDWYQSAPQTADGCYHITLSSGEEDLNNHFGNYQKATKAGYKFHDLNANHAWDADEPGLNGWTINVFDSDGVPAGSIDTANDANGEPGYYEFSLDPGTYKVCEELETDWYQSAPQTADGCYHITLSSGEEDLNNHFGNFMPVSVEVFKFFDRNEDGDQDPGEPKLPGWEFCLKDAGGNLVDADDFVGAVQAACQTTAEGALVISWTDLKPGTYTVVETTQDGWFATATTVLILPDGTPVVYQGATSVTFTLDSGEAAQLGFGNIGECRGLTPGYWKNWPNHYTPEEFATLLEGTIAGDIAEADLIFADYDASDPSDLTILSAFTLANQLTINLTQHPELPNPSDGNLFGACLLMEPWYGYLGSNPYRDYTLGEALALAVDVIDGGQTLDDAHILWLKDVLDKFANMKWYPPA